MIDNEFHQRIKKYEKKFKLDSNMLIKMLEWAEIEFDDRRFYVDDIGKNEYFVARKK